MVVIIKAVWDSWIWSILLQLLLWRQVTVFYSDKKGNKSWVKAWNDSGQFHLHNTQGSSENFALMLNKIMHFQQSQHKTRMATDVFLHPSPNSDNELIKYWNLQALPGSQNYILQTMYFKLQVLVASKYFPSHLLPLLFPSVKRAKTQEQNLYNLAPHR